MKWTLIIGAGSALGAAFFLLFNSFGRWLLGCAKHINAMDGEL